MVKIIAVRHGETVENTKGIVQGQTHGTLTRKGMRQARQLARRLAHERLSAIYSSDLRRAARTAKEIVRYHPGLELVLTKGLREKNLGELQGKKRPVGAIHVINVKTRYGETASQFRARVKRFLGSMAKRHKTGTVLLVTHGGVIRAMTLIVERRPSSHIDKLDKVKNIEIKRFDYE